MTDIINVLLWVYVGGWLLFVKPMMVMCAAYYTGFLTGDIVACTIFKCVISGMIGTALCKDAEKQAGGD